MPIIHKLCAYVQTIYPFLIQLHVHIARCKVPVSFFKGTHGGSMFNIILILNISRELVIKLKGKQYC